MRDRLLTALKVAATLGLLAFALSRIDASGLGRVLGEMGWLEAATIAVLSVASVALSAARWRRLLAHVDAPQPFSALLGDAFVGTTYNLLLPLAIGGDAVRGMRAARRAPAERVWATVAYERLVGFLALTALPLLGVLLDPAARQPLYVGSSAAMLGLFLVTLVWLHHPLGWASRLLARRAPRAAAFLGGLRGVFAGALSAPRVRVEMVGWSLLYQLVALSMLYVVALPWDAPRLVGAVFVGVPLALILSIIPITIGGHGLRESLFVTVLAGFGLSAERALALAVVWLASNLLCATIGLVILGHEHLQRRE